MLSSFEPYNHLELGGFSWKLCTFFTIAAHISVEKILHKDGRRTMRPPSMFLKVNELYSKLLTLSHE